MESRWRDDLRAARDGSHLSAATRSRRRCYDGSSTAVLRQCCGGTALALRPRGLRGTCHFRWMVTNFAAIRRQWLCVRSLLWATDTRRCARASPPSARCNNRIDATAESQRQPAATPGGGGQIPASIVIHRGAPSNSRRSQSGPTIGSACIVQVNCTDIRYRRAAQFSHPVFWLSPLHRCTSKPRQACSFPHALAFGAVLKPGYFWNSSSFTNKGLYG